MTTKADWIAVDWGTSNVRLWALDNSHKVLAQKKSDKGMSSLSPDEFESTFLDIAGDWLTEGMVTNVIICGMAGARQGWCEVPYAPVPCVAAAGNAVPISTTDPRLSVWILPGLCQKEPADVMRGEETQIAGFVAENPEFEGALCLPGTHTKWLQLHQGQIKRFCTIMTGESFALYASASILRHSVSEGWDEKSFLDAVRQCLDDPSLFTRSLFSLRALSLLERPEEGVLRARLSGSLIGAELAAVRPFWANDTVRIIGAEGVATHYMNAIRHLGGKADVLSGESLSLKGLIAAYEVMKGKLA